jgi:hypothetical protein
MVVAATRQLERSVLAELERITGMTVSLAIASSLTMAFGLQVHYGGEVPPRYVRIAERTPRAGQALAPPAPVPGESDLEEEDAPRPRRASGIIVTADDLPAGELASVSGQAPPGLLSTPEASMVPPAPPLEVPKAPPALPPRAAYEAAKVSTAAEEVLRGVSLSHDSAADRLLEMVLGPPSQPPPSIVAEPAEKRPSEAPPARRPSEAPPAGRPSEAPPAGRPSEAPPTRRPSEVPPTRRPSEVPPAADAAAALLGTLPAGPAAEAAAAVIAPPETNDEPPTLVVSAAAPGAAVVRVQAVMLGAQEGPPERAERQSAPASPVDVLRDLSGGGPAIAAPPRTALISRIAKMDALGSPTDILRYAFQLFSASFKVGLLFDTTGSAPRLRDAFGVRTGVQGFRGRPLPPGTLPSTVRNAAQPSLAAVPPDGPLADLLRELFVELPYNALFLPITVGSRVVAVLYGDNREAATPFDNVRELFHLAWAAGTRLGDLVRRRRRQEPETAAAEGSVEETERGVPPPPIDSPTR